MTAKTPEERPACVVRPAAGTRMDESCVECGHTVMLHPGSHNPSLDACLVCELELARDRPERRP